MVRRRLHCIVTGGLLTAALAALGAGASSPAIARCPAGSIGVFFDAEGKVRTLRGIEPGEQFDFWVLAFDPPGGIEAFEFSVALPPGLVCWGRQLCTGCTDFAWGDDNYFVGTGGTCFSTPGTWMLVRYRGCTSLSPIVDATICLEGSQPATLPSGEPAYLVCRPDFEIRQLLRAYEGCATINPAVVPNDAARWGALKALFRD